MRRVKTREFRTWAVLKKKVWLQQRQVRDSAPPSQNPKQQWLSRSVLVVENGNYTIGFMCSTGKLSSFLTKSHFMIKTFYQFFIYTFSIPRSLINYYIGKYLKLNMLPVELGMLNYPSFSLWLFCVEFPNLQNVLVCSGIEHSPKPSRGLWNFKFFSLETGCRSCVVSDGNQPVEHLPMTSPS